VNAEFNWWLLIVGLVIGAGLVWLVVADSRRREVDVGDAERASEARWIAEAMTDAGRGVDDEDVLDILRLHAAYLAASPPDEVFDDPSEHDPDPAPGDGNRRWVPVAASTDTAPVSAEGRSMAHPLGALPATQRAATGPAPAVPAAPVAPADSTDRGSGAN
jgi:hypothetical protein